MLLFKRIAKHIPKYVMFEILALLTYKESLGVTEFYKETFPKIKQLMYNVSDTEQDFHFYIWAYNQTLTKAPLKESPATELLRAHYLIKKHKLKKNESEAMYDIYLIDSQFSVNDIDAYLSNATLYINKKMQLTDVIKLMHFRISRAMHDFSHYYFDPDFINSIRSLMEWSENEKSKTFTYGVLSSMLHYVYKEDDEKHPIELDMAQGTIIYTITKEPKSNYGPQYYTVKEKVDI